MTISGTTKRSKIENEHFMNEYPQHGTMKKQNSNICPPPPGQGILQVKSESLDVFRTNKTSNALHNLQFMCGYTQMAVKVPMGWEMQKQNSGGFKNVTLYISMLQYVPLCCTGYIRTRETFVCQNEGGCKDGVCVSPGNCACYQGYGENNRGECVLTCPCSCPHGKCRGSTCKCDEGYKLDPTSQTCEPVCPELCVNAECSGPGVCTCLPGFKKLDSDEDHICSPDCGSKCKHGKCRAPNHCECNEGYQMANAGECLPRCAGCDHGDCVKPFHCRCHHGYSRAGDECEPICEFRCHNATCSAPNTCNCISGYTKVSPLACVPECNPTCQNADCVAPNQCQCHKYYYKKDIMFLRHICYHMSLQLIATAGQLANDLNNRHGPVVH
ncbi:hypothetical protein L9F63_019631, partial [Diploptera punctata]